MQTLTQIISVCRALKARRLLEHARCIMVTDGSQTKSSQNKCELDEGTYFTLTPRVSLWSSADRQRWSQMPTLMSRSPRNMIERYLGQTVSSSRNISAGDAFMVAAKNACDVSYQTVH